MKENKERDTKKEIQDSKKILDDVYKGIDERLKRKSPVLWPVEVKIDENGMIV